MKNAMILVAVLIIISAGVLSFLIVSLVDDGTITGGAVGSKQERAYTYTKAICNETQCQDYEISCNGTSIVKVTPVTGAIVKIKPNFEDKRPEYLKYGYCNI